ncbi:MAG: hypothetical protein JNJ45_12930 [Chthonomonas sp.]|nr:hypothetical protein [Chthonomonas sp.]
MKFSLLAFSALLASVSLASDRWSVDAQRGLIWNGSPYQPIGLRVEGTPAAIQAAYDAGVRDVLVSFSLNLEEWRTAIQLLDKLGMRYLVTLGVAAPACTGVSVQPESYRIPNFKAERYLEFPLPNCDWAYVALAYARDGSLAKGQRIPTKAGYFSSKIAPEGESEQVLLFYPHQQDMQVPDYWSGLDEHRDQLLRCLVASQPGPGFRGLLNPMGEVPAFEPRKFVPTNPLFRRELELFLKQKYTSINSAVRAWSVSAADFSSFKEMSGLVPMWGEARGVGQFLDPTRDTMFRTDLAKSQAWTDIEAVINATAARRYRRLVESIQQLADVPVIQDWRGWNGPYVLGSGLSGLGTKIRGQVAGPIAAEVGPVTTTTQVWTKPSWLVCTDAVAPDGSVAQTLIQASGGMGVRGWFFRGEPALIKDLTPSGASRVRTIPFPIGAANPVEPGPLPNGAWWLAGPGAGNRLDLGSGFLGYRYSDQQGSFSAIWIAPGTAARRVKLIAGVTEGWKFESTGGVDPAARIVKGGIEVSVGSSPLIIRGTEELPVPEESVQEALGQWETIKAKLGGNTGMVTEDGLEFEEAVKGMTRNPSGSFAQMRSTIARINLNLAPFSWIEAERSRDHTFSGVDKISGISNGSALTLHSRLSSDLFPLRASYPFEARANGMHTLWLAAKIPAQDRNKVRLRIGEQVYQLSPTPASSYGPDFAWYEAGELNLNVGQTMSVVVEVSGVRAVDLAVDAILITPNSFPAKGPTPPMTIVASKPPKKN